MELGEVKVPRGNEIRGRFNGSDCGISRPSTLHPSIRLHAGVVMGINAVKDIRHCCEVSSLDVGISVDDMDLFSGLVERGLPKRKANNRKMALTVSTI